MTLVDQAALPTVAAVDVADAVRRMLVEHDIGDAEWMRISVGSAMPSGTWTTVRALLADDANGRPGAGLAVLVARVRATHPDADDELIWSSMHVAAIWSVAELNAYLVRRAGRLVRIDAAALRFELALEGHEPGVRGLHIADPKLVVQPDDVLAGMPGVSVQTFDEMLRTMVEDLVVVATPFVEAVRGRVSLGRRGLWSTVLDLVAFPTAERQLDDTAPADQRSRVDRLLRAAVGSPLALPMKWLDFNHGDEQHTMLQTTSCCLAYKWPDDPAHPPRRDSCDAQWDKYCFSCPLIPADESIHRARYWLDNPDGDG
jgi:hypothetical protein